MTLGSQLVQTTQAAGTAMNAGEYERLALSDGRHHWELNRGRLRQKPALVREHADVIFQLGVLLHQQISRNEYRIHVDNGRLRRATENYSIPDLIVIPRALSQHLRGRPDWLEVYPDPLPLVVEVWSPSTGDYDVAAKLPEYQQRGDQEIWYLHPYQHTLTAWRRRPDGSYVESTYTTGSVPVMSLPNVVIDLSSLFDAD